MAAIIPVAGAIAAGVGWLLSRKSKRRSNPVSDYSSQITQKEAELKAKQDEYERLSSKNQTLKDEAEEASRLVETANKNYKKTEESLEKMRNTNSQNQTQIQKLEEKLKDQSNSKKEIEKNYNDVQEALKKSKKEQENQKKNLEEQKTELKRTKQILDQLNDENSKYRKDLEDQRQKMEDLEKTNKDALSKIAHLNASNAEINKKLAEHQEKYERDMRENEEKHKKHVQQVEKELNLTKQESDAYLKSLNAEKRKYAYNVRFAKSEKLKKHLIDYPQSFNIQIIGERGVGKSSLINFLVRKKLNLKNVKKAKTGTTETTIDTNFFDVTQAFNKVLTPHTTHVFFVDQPGIGGAKINRAGYLEKFSPGHYDLTFVLGQNGLNEDAIFLLDHLQHHKKPLFFIRTKVDADLCKGFETSDSEDDLDSKITYQDVKNATEEFVKPINSSINCFFVGRGDSKDGRNEYEDYNRIIQVIKFMIKHVDKLASFEDENGLISASLLNSIDKAQAE